MEMIQNIESSAYEIEEKIIIQNEEGEIVQDFSFLPQGHQNVFQQIQEVPQDFFGTLVQPQTTEGPSSQEDLKYPYGLGQLVYNQEINQPPQTFRLQDYKLENNQPPSNSQTFLLQDNNERIDAPHMSAQNNRVNEPNQLEPPLSANNNQLVAANCLTYEDKEDMIQKWVQNQAPTAENGDSSFMNHSIDSNYFSKKQPIKTAAEKGDSSLLINNDSTDYDSNYYGPIVQSAERNKSQNLNNNSYDKKVHPFLWPFVCQFD